MSYQCQICLRSYHEKFNFDRHRITCEFLHKSRRERRNDIDMEQTEEMMPTKREMFLLMQDMSLKISKLETELKKLKSVQSKKMDMIEWLNNLQQQPEQDFHTWITTAVYDEIKNVLDIVYRDDLLHGSKELFKNTCCQFWKNKIDLPIRAFDHKSNQFYIYEKNPNSVEETRQYHWRRMTNDEFDRILAKIDHQFVVNFRIHWYDVNKDNMNQEKYKDMYVHHYAKILGNDRMSESGRHHHLRQYLYDLMKETVKAMIEV